MVLYNETAQPLTVYPTLMNFNAGKMSLDKRNFILRDQDPKGTALAPWVRIPSSRITLTPKQRTEVSVAINIPNNATPGGHYGAMLFGDTPPAKAGAVGVNAQVAVLLLVRVNGKVTEQGRIAEFSRVGSGVYEALPIDLFLRFENDGNTHLQPSGTIFVTNLLGMQVAALPFNPTVRNVLPQSIRRFSTNWQQTSVSEKESLLARQWKNFAIGPYTARAVVQYGVSGKSETASTSFSVWPWQLLAVVFGVVVVLWALRGLVKRYNRWILKGGIRSCCYW